MASTYELIASATVGAGGASSIDFTSIPATYTDLCVVLSTRSNNSGVTDELVIQPNASSSSMTLKNLIGAATSVFSETTIRPVVAASGVTASTFTSTQFYIPNYAGSAYKSISVDSADEINSTVSNYLYLGALLWSNTSAISSLKFVLGASTFVQYSTAYLYGVKNA